MRRSLRSVGNRYQMSQIPNPPEESFKKRLLSFIDQSSIGELVTFISAISTISAVSWIISYDKYIQFPFMYVVSIYDYLVWTFELSSYILLFTFMTLLGSSSNIIVANENKVIIGFVSLGSVIISLVLIIVIQDYYF